MDIIEFPQAMVLASRKFWSDRSVIIKLAIWRALLQSPLFTFSRCIVAMHRTKNTGGNDLNEISEEQERRETRQTERQGKKKESEDSVGDTAGEKRKTRRGPNEILIKFYIIWRRRCLGHCARLGLKPLSRGRRQRRLVFVPRVSNTRAKRVVASSPSFFLSFSLARDVNAPPSRCI